MRGALPIASLGFILRPLQCLTNLTCLLEARGPSCFSLCRRFCVAVATPNRSMIRMRPELGSGIPRSEAAVIAIRRRLLQEVGVVLGESTASANWDLQKFYDSIDVRLLLGLGAEHGFPIRVAVVDLQVHLGLRALRWAGALAK